MPEFDTILLEGNCQIYCSYKPVNETKSYSTFVTCQDENDTCAIPCSTLFILEYKLKKFSNLQCILPFQCDS